MSNLDNINNLLPINIIPNNNEELISSLFAPNEDESKMGYDETMKDFPKPVKFVTNKCDPTSINSFLQKKKTLKQKTPDGEDTSNGRWTQEEQKKFAEAVLLFSNDWKSIQAHVITRCGTQIRSHAQKFLMRLKENKFLQSKGLQAHLSWTKAITYLRSVLTYEEMKEALDSVELGMKKKDKEKTNKKKNETKKSKKEKEKNNSEYVKVNSCSSDEFDKSSCKSEDSKSRNKYSITNKKKENIFSEDYDINENDDNMGVKNIKSFKNSSNNDKASCKSLKKLKHKKNLEKKKKLLIKLKLGDEESLKNKQRIIDIDENEEDNEQEIKTNKNGIHNGGNQNNGTTKSPRSNKNSQISKSTAFEDEDLNDLNNLPSVVNNFYCIFSADFKPRKFSLDSQMDFNPTKKFQKDRMNAKKEVEILQKFMESFNTLPKENQNNNPTVYEEDLNEKDAFGGFPI